MSLDLRELLMVIIAVATAIACIVIVYSMTNFDATKFTGDTLQTFWGIVAVGIVIFGGALTYGFEPRFRDFVDKNKGDPAQKKQHSDGLYKEVYRMLMHVFIRKDHDLTVQFKVPTSYEEYLEHSMSLDLTHDPSLMNVSRLKNYDWAIKHLKHREYKAIRKAWENANKLREECSIILKEKPRLQVFEDVATAKMKQAFPNFVNGDNVENNIDMDFYSVRNIARMLEDRYYWIKQGDGSIVVLKGPYNYGKNHRITLYGTPIMASPNENVLSQERVQDVLRAIINDPEVLARIEKEDTAWNVMADAMDQFRNNLNPLVRKLGAGNTIKGRCDLGY